MKSKTMMLKGFIIISVFLLIIVSVHPVVAETSGNGMIFTIQDKTTHYDVQTATIIDKDSLDISLTPLDIPDYVIASANEKKESGTITTDDEIYNLVIFNNPIPNRLDTVVLPITLYGKEYEAVLSRMPESIDDGIDSYLGSITGIPNSEVLLTFSGNYKVRGSISYPGEYLRIKPIQRSTDAQMVTNPVHIIYSEYDIIQSSNFDFCAVDDSPSMVDTFMDVSQTSLSSINSEFDFVTIDILVVTDDAFYNLEGSDWIDAAQDYILAANSATSFGREDVGVYFNVIGYDSSRKNLLGSHYDVETEPLNALEGVYPTSYLNSIGADLCLYLGGYDRDGTAQGQAGLPYGQHKRYAWCQMVNDWSGDLYSGDEHSRTYCVIHELGHNIGATHEQATARWLNGNIVTNTVMVGVYYGILFHSFEFSSTYSPSYIGDATHDNARLIRSYKLQVSQYT